MNISTKRTNALCAAALIFWAGSALAQTQPVTRPAAVAATPAAPTSAGTLGPHSTLPDIHDIRGPKRLGMAPWPAVLAALAVLAVGGGYAAWAWRRARRRVRLPHEIALERLEAARALMRAGNSREFSSTVSSIVREYVEHAFHVIATHLTTHEFLSGLLHTPNAALADSRALLADFLEACDLAKFGGWNLSVDAMTSMQTSARRFIESAAAAECAAAAPATSAAITTLGSGTQTASLAEPGSTNLGTRDTYDSLPTT